MRLLVRMSLPSSRRGNRWVENYEIFECQVVRLRGPVHSTRDGRRSLEWIYADIYLPEKYSAKAFARLFAPDGTYPVEVVVTHNRKTLEPFLASGDLVWDVREAE